MKCLYFLIISIGILLTAGCGSASVPEEVVKLSYQMGEDMNALQRSYEKLIHQRFDDLRQKRLQYLENRWKPRFIKNWIEIGRLLDVANGKVVWSFEKSDFVAPTPSKANAQLLATLEEWTSQGMRQIEEKKQELIKPLDDQEKELQDDVRLAFDRLMKANAQITAHLNSIRKVQQVQDEFLEALNIKELRDKIDSKLADLSRKAEEGLASVKKADELTDKITRKTGGN
jgi:hypothetical protein